jgi:hypothetical protein
MVPMMNQRQRPLWREPFKIDLLQSSHCTHSEKYQISSLNLHYEIGRYLYTYHNAQEIVEIVIISIEFIL